MTLKSKWQKFPVSDKTIIILFLLALVFVIAGTIMLLSVKINGIFNGFNLVSNIGVIPSLQYFEPNNLINLIFLKIGIIMTIFLMPICAGISILWFIIDRTLFKN